MVNCEQKSTYIRIRQPTKTNYSTEVESHENLKWLASQMHWIKDFYSCFTQWQSFATNYELCITNGYEPSHFVRFNIPLAYGCLRWCCWSFLQSMSQTQVHLICDGLDVKQVSDMNNSFNFTIILDIFHVWQNCARDIFQLPLNNFQYSCELCAPSNKLTINKKFCET